MMDLCSIIFFHKPDSGIPALFDRPHYFTGLGNRNERRGICRIIIVTFGIKIQRRKIGLPECQRPPWNDFAAAVDTVCRRQAVLRFYTMHCSVIAGLFR